MILLKINKKKPSIRLYIFLSLEEKVQATTLLINSLISRPTHLGFFDICLLLVILTMATHSNREREREKKRKRPSMLLSPQLSTLTFSSFFLSPLLLLFLLLVLFYETKKRTDVRTHFTLFFLPSRCYSPVSRQQMLVSTRRKKKNPRKTSAAKQMRKRNTEREEEKKICADLFKIRKEREREKTHT